MSTNPVCDGTLLGNCMNCLRGKPRPKGVSYYFDQGLRDRLEDFLRTSNRPALLCCKCDSLASTQTLSSSVVQDSVSCSRQSRGLVLTIGSVATISTSSTFVLCTTYICMSFCLGLCQIDCTVFERLLLIDCYDGCVTVAILLKCETLARLSVL